jgi:magnesium chelatase family protein
MMIRPFRAPHHTISDTALVGGGTIPRPGEVSLAHNGVLFLDELPEFRRTALEVLRQPMEDGKVLISRTRHSCIYPSNFMLIAAMNPCPCGYFGDARRSCICSVNSIVKYRNRISGPLLDRIDIQVEVPSVSFEHLRGSHPEETSGIIKKRVESSRQIQNERLKDYNLHANSRMETRHVQQFCRLDSECLDLLKYAVEKLGFSARAYARIIKVARTISDLEGKSDILPEHIAEAIQYRILDRKICE